MAKKLISYDDEAEGLGLPDVVEDRMASALPPMGGALQRLDWQGITLPTTTAETISFFTSTLGDAAERKEIGTASNDSPIYAFTAGNPNAPHALLVSGVHGHELQPVAAAWRWFEAFALKTSPAMSELHSRLRVTWVPHINPSGYDAYSRETSGGVDLNRNFPFNWALENSSYKGAEPLSAPESQAVKDLIDAEQIGAVLDCHNAGFEDQFGSTVTIVGPPPATIGNRGVAEAALSDMRQWFGADDPTYQFTTFPSSPIPTLKNWANKYLLWEKGRTNANSAIIESAANLRGSLGHTLSDEGARLYCQMIHSYLVRWVSDGQHPPAVTPYVWHGRSWGADSTIPIGDPSGNGRLVDQTSSVVHINVRSSAGDYLAVPLLGPGRYIITYDLSMTANEPGNFRTYIAIGPAQVSGDLPWSGRGRAIQTLAAGESATISRSMTFNVSEADLAEDIQVYMIQLIVNMSAGSAVMAANNGANIRVDYSPNSVYQPSPYIQIART